jgi:hypothetical protein
MPFFENLCNLVISEPGACRPGKTNRKLLSEYDHLHWPVATKCGGSKDILFEGTTLIDRSHSSPPLIPKRRERERAREREMKRRKKIQEYEL